MALLPPIIDKSRVAVAKNENLAVYFYPQNENLTHVLAQVIDPVTSKNILDSELTLFSCTEAESAIGSKKIAIAKNSIEEYDTI
jgi:hypothetical protein